MIGQNSVILLIELVRLINTDQKHVELLVSYSLFSRVMFNKVDGNNLVCNNGNNVVCSNSNNRNSI